MAKLQLIIRNDTHFVSFAHDAHNEAKQFRKSNPAFSRRKIREVLQLNPKGITFGKVYAINGPVD